MIAFCDHRCARHNPIHTILSRLSGVMHRMTLSGDKDEKIFVV